MADEPEKQPNELPHPSEKEVKASAAIGATALGCLGAATLPWSILVFIFFLFGIFWMVHRLWMH